MLTLELSSSVMEIPNDAYSRVLQAYCLILENNAKETNEHIPSLLPQRFPIN